MTDFKIKLASKVIAVNSIYAASKTFCKDYIIYDKDITPDCSITITEEDITREAKYNDLLHKSFTIFQEGYEHLETLAIYRKIATELINSDTILVHGSVIALDNEAYLFIAPSGTGKSTHTRLWIKKFKQRAFIINDDKPLIRITDNKIYACGTPWSGKHNLNTNIEIPLKGICYLVRANKNSIEQLTIEDSYEYILRQTYRPTDDELSLHSLDLIDTLLSKVPFYKMNLNNYKWNAVKVAYKKMIIDNKKIVNQNSYRIIKAILLII